MIKLKWIRWAGHVASMREQYNSYRILAEPEGKKPL
jgi:hypothetical protein